MSESWDEDIDRWMESFNELVSTIMGPDFEMDDNDEMAITNIVAKVKNGKMSIPSAAHEIAKWFVGRQGFKMMDKEGFDLEMAVGGLLEITDEFKTFLLMTGEPGIADGVLQMYADPIILRIATLGDIADIDHQPGVGIVAKHWFDCSRLNHTEWHNVQWAVVQALQAKASKS